MSQISLFAYFRFQRINVLAVKALITFNVPGNDAVESESAP